MHARRQTESSEIITPVFSHSTSSMHAPPRHVTKTQTANRTNITEEAGVTYASSRGVLVASFLADPRGHSDSSRNLASAAAALTFPGTSYAGFNLLLLEPSP